MSVAAIYELATTFNATAVRELYYEQAADLVLLTRMGTPIKRLRRFDHDNWILDDAPIGPQVAAPASVSVTVVNPKLGDADYVGEGKAYVVTSVNEDGQESVISPQGTGINDLNLKGDHNVVSWPIVTGVRTYRVYEARAGMYGFLGEVRDSLSFKDDNILANFADGPPIGNNPFSSKSPAVCGFYADRLWLGRQSNKPNAVYASKAADIFNFDKSSPVRATDSISLGLRARRQNAIRHFVPMRDLVIMSADGIWSLRSTADGAIGPAMTKTVPESYQGCGDAKPEVVGNVYFYTSPRGESVRTGGYQFERDGYSGNNISVFAQHLFSRFKVTELAWCETPSSVLWGKRDDGKLLALTWMPEQEVWGWTLCETAGTVESICSVPENGMDVLYCVVRRRIGGVLKRYVERMSKPEWIDEGWSDLSRAMCLDACDYFESDTPFNIVSRLHWLEGCDVVCLGDGVVYRGHTVTNGVLTPPLPNPVTRLVVGLPYDAYLQTLPFVSQTKEGVTKGAKTNIGMVHLDLMNTAGFGDGLLVGANAPYDEEPALSVEPPETILTQTPPDPFTGEISQSVEAGEYKPEEATVTIWQKDPLPVVVLGIHYDVAVNNA